MIPEGEHYARLRRLWDEHRADAFPDALGRDPRIQEVALYESWLGSLVEAALALGGRLSSAHRRMLDVREAEGNQPLWSLAGEMGEPVRSYVARLIALQELLTDLPLENR
ncbi:MAG: hypothetical protein M3075_18100 [Candidatus Dormibacteraeota bacterium]|nr:hypothetical protein [Candidatus Dormibacteraeota bacterium]